MAGVRRGSRLIAAWAGLCLCLAGAVLFAQAPPEGGGGGGVVASKSTKTYHRPSCEAVKKISAKNKLDLASSEEAATQKFKPCPICKPNLADAPSADAEKPDGAMPTGKTKKGALKKGGPAATADDEKALKFSRDIAPILVGNCTGCHNAKELRGKFDMTSFQKLMAGSAQQKVIVPGKPEESLLVLKVRGEAPPPGRKMPPGAQKNLAPETIAKIEQWIKAGARLDAGFEPTATLDSIAPSPAALRRAQLAGMTPEERDKKLEEAGLERWKKATAKTTPTATSGKNFLLLSTLPKDRAERLLKTMETQRTTLGQVLGTTGGAALTGPEKISLYVFKEVGSYVEFVRGIENREIEAGVEAHGRLDVEQPYVAAVDPLNGADEPAGSATSGAKPKRSAKSKKAQAADEAPEGPDRTLAGLLSEQLAVSAANAAGKPPKWLSNGLGAYLASQADPRGSNYYRKLREEAAAQYTIGWDTKAQEVLGDEGNPETLRALGFSLCEWLGSTPAFRPAFPYFVQGLIREGGTKLEAVIEGCFGKDVTREQFLKQWGGFVATRYGARRR